VYIFKNIRFAAPPIGTLRFAKPTLPQPTTGVQINPKGGTCPQFLPTKYMIQATNGLSGTLLSELSKTVDIAKWMGGGPSSEDCLFLDVYVPGEAMRKKAVLPVVNWIYGGAYVMGNKEKHYNGTAILEASDNRVVYVAGNYRLGAFGWLSGTSVEEDNLAVANAGLYDQRAVLEWIQKYIVSSLQSI
jgi:carboxylesterase type B